ncbi:2OG-Fe(II) oxygenase [Bacillus inaquosorum]|uniref:2OG-Fe(II) oxygenase n=1 Tax=Bacillus inaquosorum TaxID=483913 RepID=UPI003F5CF4AF
MLVIKNVKQEWIKIVQDIKTRVENLNWDSIQNELDEQGLAKLPAILTKEECEFFIELYCEEESNRTTINMTRYRLGNGEYKYFSYPLPEIIQSLRESFYLELGKTANRWLGYLKKTEQFPDHHFSRILNKDETSISCYSIPRIVHSEFIGSIL